MPLLQHMNKEVGTVEYSDSIQKQKAYETSETGAEPLGRKSISIERRKKSRYYYRSFLVVSRIQVTFD